MNHTRISKFLVLSVISLFVVCCFVTFETTFVRADSEWVAKPMYILQSASPMSAPSGYSPSQMKTAYGLPPSGGAGTTIAIIDAYATTSIFSDLTSFSNQFNLTAPILGSNFVIHPMSTNLATNSGWALETCLDVEWAHAIAPQATILLVEAKSANEPDLISAIEYATNKPEVVAISMSWGGPEFPGEPSSDSLFTSNYGVVFFASSGDNGSALGVNWPACSANVVGVGGTTLNLDPDGTVISETAWSNSGGGISEYEPTPSYQTSYGLTTAYRSVPDVSYNADPSTGVSVCDNSQWYIVGGTSAGAPQWAGIQADGLSATLGNLYGKAKSAYSSYFRDITSGSNGLYNATVGYDQVTGLGSPLTDNFNASLAVSPTSGPGGGLITLYGTGFTAGSSVNISYLNAMNGSWVSIVNNLATDSSNLNYTFNAPDLLQNSPTGDNPPLSDNIVFQAQDNSNGNSYNTTIPYMEWRRGLTQIANDTAAGLYGNNTDLSTTAFVQNNQLIPVVGEWFDPGNVSFIWDGTTNLATFATDENGFFNATLQVPTTSAGPHVLTIIDADSSFSVNLTRSPLVTNDYDGLWHASNVTINLTPDYNGTETYYQINNGPIENVSANGQPLITTEGSNNTLEYWITWNIYGTGTMALPHFILTGIQLQTTPPTGSMQINGGEASTTSTSVTLTVNATDLLSGISQIRFSNDDSWAQSSWETYTSVSNWQLSGGNGAKTVYCQIQDNAGLTTILSASILLSSPQPISPLLSSNPSPTSPLGPSPTQTPIPTVTPIPSANRISNPSPSTSPSQNPSITPQAPELSINLIIIVIALSTLTLMVKHTVDKKKTTWQNPAAKIES